MNTFFKCLKNAWNLKIGPKITHFPDKEKSDRTNILYTIFVRELWTLLGGSTVKIENENNSVNPILF